MVRPTFSPQLGELHERRTTIEASMDQLVDETTEVLRLPPGK